MTSGARVRAAGDGRPLAPRILVVDDEPGIRKTLSQVLADEGYVV